MTSVLWQRKSEILGGSESRTRGRIKKKTNLGPPNLGKARWETMHPCQ